jgi:hypothetical protein
VLAHGLGVEAAVLAQVEDVEAARVGAEEEGLRGEGVQDGRAVGGAGGAVARREADLGDDDAGFRGEVLDDRVGAGRVECWNKVELVSRLDREWRCGCAGYARADTWGLTLAVMAVGQVAAAPLMAMSAPDALDQAPAAARAAALVVLIARKPKALDPTARQADGQQRLGRVQDLGEQVCRERKRAEVLEHGEGLVRRKQLSVPELQLITPGAAIGPIGPTVADLG